MNSIRINTRFIEKVLQIAKAHYRSNQCIITPFSLFLDFVLREICVDKGGGGRCALLVTGRHFGSLLEGLGVQDMLRFPSARVDVRGFIEDVPVSFRCMVLLGTSLAHLNFQDTYCRALLVYFQHRDLLLFMRPVNSAKEPMVNWRG